MSGISPRQAVEVYRSALEAKRLAEVDVETSRQYLDEGVRQSLTHGRNVADFVDDRDIVNAFARVLDGMARDAKKKAGWS